MSSSDDKTLKVSGDDNSLHEFRQFFFNELRALYCSEKMLTRILPKIENESYASLLKRAVRHHTEQTNRHVSQLEAVLVSLNIVSAGESKCESMSAILKDAGRLIDEAKDNSVRDIGIISSLLKIGKYKIAAYGVMMSLATVTNSDNVKLSIQEIYLDAHKAVDLLKQVMEVLLKSKNSGFNMSGALD